MQEILTRTYEITASDVDCHGLCRLSALLGHMQNLATEHAIILGIGGPRMMTEHNAVWLLARTQLRLDRPIPYPGEVTISTWPRGITKSATVFRDFDLFIGDERIGEATTSWVLADLVDRKVLKPTNVPALVDSPRPAVVKDCIPQKIKAPADMTQEMVRVVTYSDTDINGHMNNTKYADVACDAIRYDLCKGRFISEVQINYLHECFPGDELLVLCGEAEGVRYVRGTDAAGCVRFEVGLGLEGLECDSG